MGRLLLTDPTTVTSWISYGEPVPTSDAGNNPAIMEDSNNVGGGDGDNNDGNAIASNDMKHRKLVLMRRRPAAVGRVAYDFDEETLRRGDKLRIGVVDDEGGGSCRYGHANGDFRGGEASRDASAASRAAAGKGGGESRRHW